MSCYSYAVKYHPGNPVGERSSVYEYCNNVSTTPGGGPYIVLENGLFIYDGGNQPYYGEYFYLECRPEIGVAHLYCTRLRDSGGQEDYVKTGNPILSSQ